MIGITAGVISIYLMRRFIQGGKNIYKPSMESKVIIVTGSNSGIGYETALTLAKLGGTVVLACRDSERGLAAEKNIVKASGN